MVLEMGAVDATGWIVAPYVQTVPAGPDCVASVEVMSPRLSGVMVPRAVPFLGREPGVGSIMPPGFKLYWSRTDSHAEGLEAATDGWSGTWVIREWSAGIHVFDLVDGVHCDEPESEGGCAPEEGVLTIEGLVVDDGVVHTGPVLPEWVDLASGESLCGSVW